MPVRGMLAARGLPQGLAAEGRLVPGPASLLERDPGLAGRFLSLIEDGVPRNMACLGSGFSYRTMYGWVRQGLLPDAKEPYATFARDLYATEVELLRRLILRHNLAEPSQRTDNKALEWYLERRFPKEFGPEPVMLAEPADDLAGELESDADHWETMRQWFLAPTEQLLALMSETGLLPSPLTTRGVDGESTGALSGEYKGRS